MSKKSMGYESEHICCKYLQQKGYKIINTNYYIRYGEIDIVAVKDNVTVFVEVKARYNLDEHPAELGWSYRKQQNFIQTVNVYLSRHDQVQAYQIDLMVLYWRNRKIIHYKSVDIHPRLLKLLPY